MKRVCNPFHNNGIKNVILLLFLDSPSHLIKIVSPREEHIRDFVYAEGKSRFTDHVMKAMETREEIMPITHNMEGENTRKDGNAEILILFYLKP